VLGKGGRFMGLHDVGEGTTRKVGDSGDPSGAYRVQLLSIVTHQQASSSLSATHMTVASGCLHQFWLRRSSILLAPPPPSPPACVQRTFSGCCQP
jgi:hypothetical protein